MQTGLLRRAGDVERLHSVARAKSRCPEPPVPPSLLDFVGAVEHLAAQEIFRLIEVPMASDMAYFFDGKLGLVGMKIEDDMDVTGKKLSEIGLSRFTVVAVVRDGQTLIPNGDTQLQLKDKVYVLGQTRGFQFLNGLVKKKGPSFRRIVIAGSGLVAQYLIRLLQGKKLVPEIRMIDTNFDHMKGLAQELSGCHFVNADPTKIENLKEEGLGSGDIFVSLLDSESTNFVACMLAHKLGVKEIICEIGREDYHPSG